MKTRVISNTKGWGNGEVQKLRKFARETICSVNKEDWWFARGRGQEAKEDETQEKD